MDAYCKPFYNKNINDNLDAIIFEEYKVQVNHPGGWSPIIKIFRVVNNK